MSLVLVRSSRLRAASAAVLLISLSGLSACGLTGDLKRGKPIFGEPNEKTAPAELPDPEKNALPPLPSRPDAEDTEEADDELLGGPGG